MLITVCLFIGCLTSQQHTSVSQGRICLDNGTCCHTRKAVADHTCSLTQSLNTDTGPTNFSTEPMTPSACQAATSAVTISMSLEGLDQAKLGAIACPPLLGQMVKHTATRVELMTERLRERGSLRTTFIDAMTETTFTSLAGLNNQAKKGVIAGPPLSGRTPNHFDTGVVLMTE